MTRRAIRTTRSCTSLAAMALAACASAATPTSRTQTIDMPNTPGKGLSISISPSAIPFIKTVAVPIDQLWHLIPATYDSLGIPLTVLEPKSHIVGNEGFKARQRLAKVRMSTYFECGTTQVDRNADSYELYIVMMTQLEAQGADSTKITTTADAAAKPLQFAQDYSHCTSKGVLEQSVFDIIMAGVKK
jgi:hypothetical protein